MEASGTESPMVLQHSPKGTKFLLANSGQKSGRVRCGIRKKSQHQHEEHSGDIAVIHMTCTEATTK